MYHVKVAVLTSDVLHKTCVLDLCAMTPCGVSHWSFRRNSLEHSLAEAQSLHLEPDPERQLCAGSGKGDV